jgi:hypothetical protein
LIAFFQGFTGAGLFGRANLPGAPTEFIDSRSLEEFHSTGEFEETLARHRDRISRRSNQPGYPAHAPGEDIVRAVDPSLPALIPKAGMETQRQKFLYAALTFGFLLAPSVVGGFVSLAVHDRPKSAACLISAGVLGLVTGFQTVRLGGNADHVTPAKRSARRSKTSD